MADERNPPSRRTLGDYVMQQGPRHFSSIAVPSTTKTLKMKSGFLNLISSHQFTGMDNEDPYTHLSTFYELVGTMGFEEGDIESVYLRLFPFSLAGKAKEWLKSHRNQSLTSWNDVEEKFLHRFFPLSRYIKAKSDISTFRQGANETFCEAWERFKLMLRRCSNHGFEDISQLSIFHNGVRADTKMILGAAAGGTMMAVDVEQATRIIDALASTDYQARHDRQTMQQKKGMFDLNTTYALLAQNKILTQQIEALTKQMTKFLQQLQVVQSSQNQSQSMSCDFCGGNYPNGQCSYQNNPSQEDVTYMGNQGRQGGFSGNYQNNNMSQGWRGNQNQGFGWKQDVGSSNKQPPYHQQQQIPSTHDRTTKLEETLEKFIQASMANQKKILKLLSEILRHKWDNWQNN